MLESRWSNQTVKWGDEMKMLMRILDSEVVARNPFLAYPAFVLAAFVGLVWVLLDKPNVWGNGPTIWGVCCGYVLAVLLGAVVLWMLRPAAGALAPRSEMVTHTRILSALSACRGNWRHARKNGVLDDAVSKPAFGPLAKKILSHQYVLRKR